MSKQIEKAELRTTDGIFSPGFALGADRKTMEERVRGVFGRPRSTALAAAVAFAIIALAFLFCFTTVLRPVKAEKLPEELPSAAGSLPEGGE